MGLVSVSDQEARRRRTKNIGLAVLLLALAGLFYLITIVKLTGNVS
jgi:hypothetical protein